MPRFSAPSSRVAWRAHVQSALPLLGHRNWIAVVDAAYPQQVAPGIELIAAGEGLLSVVKGLFEELKRAPHLRPLCCLDSELERVSANGHPDATTLREDLLELLVGARIRAVPHQQNIAMLDEVARSFRVLVIKTTECVPYTSLFIELACGYWDDAAESELQASMNAGR